MMRRKNNKRKHSPDQLDSRKKLLQTDQPELTSNFENLGIKHKKHGGNRKLISVKSNSKTRHQKEIRRKMENVQFILKKYNTKKNRMDIKKYEGTLPDFNRLRTYIRRVFGTSTDSTWLCRNNLGVYYVLTNEDPEDRTNNNDEASDVMVDFDEKSDRKDEEPEDNRQEELTNCLNKLGHQMELILIEYQISLRMGLTKYDVDGYSWKELIQTFKTATKNQEQIQDWTLFGDDQTMHSEMEYLAYLYTKQEKQYVTVTARKNVLDRQRYFKAYDPGSYKSVNSSKLSVEDLDNDYLLTHQTYEKERVRFIKSGAEKIDHRIKCQENHKANFEKWLLWMHFGHNLLCYGLGSKKKILQEFLLKKCNYGHCFIINGFHPSTRLPEVMRNICRHVLPDYIKYSGNVREQIQILQKELTKENNTYKDIFILFNNIDGPVIKSSQCQEQLSRLSQIPKVHFIASIDHLLAMSLWDPQLEARFCWRRIEVTTYEPYDLETHYDPTNVLEPTGNQRVKGITSVLKSLTPNHRELLEILAEQLIEQEEESGKMLGITFQTFYNECYDSMLVSNDTVFKELITELVDHHLITIKKEQQSTSNDVYTIPHSKEVILKHIIDTGL